MLKYLILLKWKVLMFWVTDNILMKKIKRSSSKFMLEEKIGYSTPEESDVLLSADEEVTHYEASSPRLRWFVYIISCNHI